MTKCLEGFSPIFVHDFFLTNDALENQKLRLFRWISGRIIGK